MMLMGRMTTFDISVETAQELLIKSGNDIERASQIK